MPIWIFMKKICSNFGPPPLEFWLSPCSEAFTFMAHQESSPTSVPPFEAAFWQLCWSVPRQFSSRIKTQFTLAIPIACNGDGARLAMKIALESDKSKSCVWWLQRFLSEPKSLFPIGYVFSCWIRGQNREFMKKVRVI